MLSVLLNWIYVLFTTFCFGFGVSALSGKLFGYHIKRVDSLIMAGLVVTTVYTQFFSLFAGVGMVANLIMLAVCIMVVCFFYKDIIDVVSKRLKEKKTGYVIAGLCLVILWAYFTSRGYIHYDSDLYHAQSIRWIEEYGVVPGLGNLHERFAYNSSFFAVSALYSMKFLCGESLHTMSGFFALLLSITTLDITVSFKNKKFRLADYARVGAIYYLTTIIDEVVSPASDYSIMCVIFFIVIKWLDLLEVEEKQSAPYALLCVLGVYALTLKLTAGLIILLVIKPVYLLIKEKKRADIFKYIAIGLLVAIPWFARTVMISGWLIYPLPSLDLFNFDWEMNAAAIEVDAAQITTWGRALYNASLVDLPVSQWIPNWFSTTLSGTEKILILGNIACIVMYMIVVVILFIKKQWKHLDVALVMLTVICSYLFWQFSAPLLRYGYAYVLLLDFLMLGWMLIRLGWNKIQNVLYFALILFGIYKIFTMGEYAYGCRQVDCYFWQAGYGIYEMENYEVDGYTFYYPVQGDRVGYDYFPAAPTAVDIELRGIGIEDGFRRVQ